MRILVHLIEFVCRSILLLGPIFYLVSHSKSKYIGLAYLQQELATFSSNAVRISWITSIVMYFAARSSKKPTCSPVELKLNLKSRGYSLVLGLSCLVTIEQT